MLFPESDTNLFHVHFRVFRARNTVAPDINEVMKYNSHAPQGGAWHSNIWQPAWQTLQGCLRLKFGHQTFVFWHLMAIWWKCLLKMEWDLAQGGPVQETTIDSDVHWQVGTVRLSQQGWVCPLWLLLNKKRLSTWRWQSQTRITKNCSKERLAILLWMVPLRKPES